MYPVGIMNTSNGVKHLSSRLVETLITQKSSQSFTTILNSCYA